MTIKQRKQESTGHLSIFYVCLWEPFSEFYVQVSTWLSKSLYQYLERKYGDRPPANLYEETVEKYEYK